MFQSLSKKTRCWGEGIRGGGHCHDLVGVGRHHSTITNTINDRAFHQFLDMGNKWGAGWWRGGRRLQMVGLRNGKKVPSRKHSKSTAKLFAFFLQICFTVLFTHSLCRAFVTLSHVKLHSIGRTSCKGARFSRFFSPWFNLKALGTTLWDYSK